MNRSAKFSEQQLIDCDILYNDGCYNGRTFKAFDYLIHNPIMNESDYPYSGAVGKWCHLREENATNTIASY